MLQLPSVAFDPVPNELFPPKSILSAFPRGQKRLLQLLEKGSPNDPNAATKRWSLDFLLSPDSLQGSPSDPHHLSRVRFTRNVLYPGDPFQRGSSVAPFRFTDGEPEQIDVPTSALFRSVGYRSQPLAGLDEIGVEFDKRRGIIPNDGLGRVSSSRETRESSTLADGSRIFHVPGLYCAGWVKTGPTGVIASTMMDAFTTAEVMASDLERYRAQVGGMSLLNAPGDSGGQGWEGVRKEIEKGDDLRVVSWQDWLHIDAVERERGKQHGKLRDKFGRVEEMLGVL